MISLSCLAGLKDKAAGGLTTPYTLSMLEGDPLAT
jgi:hypothetical protein